MNGVDVPGGTYTITKVGGGFSLTVTNNDANDMNQNTWVSRVYHSNGRSGRRPHFGWPPLKNATLGHNLVARFAGPSVP